VQITEVAYDVDERSMVGRLVVPDRDGPLPGVLVIPGGPGLSDFELGQARQLADLGYVAFAADYHGGGRFVTDRDEIGARVGELSADPERAATIANAGLEVLLDEERTDRSRMATIGYCFGGAIALELGRSGADLKAIVGFHALLSTPRPEQSSKIRASVLVCGGAEDPIVSAEQRQAFVDDMTSAGVDWQMVLYGGAQHSFTNPASDLHGVPGIAYDATAAARSWQAMLDFFGEVLV
jgi:dienelactone hydrolase